MPSSVSRRPVVIRIGSPMRFSAIRWLAASGDAGDDLDGEFDIAALLYTLEDAQRAVIERRIAPDQERAAAVLGKFVADQRFVDAGDVLVPIVHGCPVGWRGFVAHRHVELDAAGFRVGDEAVADFAAQAGEVAFFCTLVRDEQHVGAVQAGDGLDGHMLGISGADADDEKGSHGRISCLIGKCMSSREQADRASMLL
jgi:hypothetical protein